MTIKIPAPHPTTSDMRDDLAHLRHTITVERLDPATAREVNMLHAAGQLAIVERHDGRCGKICAVESDTMLCTLEELAQSYGYGYRATYIPAPPVPLWQRIMYAARVALGGAR